MGGTLRPNDPPKSLGPWTNTQVIVTDSATEMQLLAVYPESKQFLCVFHEQQAVWHWLLDSKNNILQNERKEIMVMFKTVLYLTDEKKINCILSKVY